MYVYFDRNMSSIMILFTQLLVCRKTKGLFTLVNRDGYMIDPNPHDSKKEIFSPVIPNPLAMEHSKFTSHFSAIIILFILL